MLDSVFHHRGRHNNVNLFGHTPAMGVVRKLCAEQEVSAHVSSKVVVCVSCAKPKLLQLHYEQAAGLGKEKMIFT